MHLMSIAPPDLTVLNVPHILRRLLCISAQWVMLATRNQLKPLSLLLVYERLLLTTLHSKQQLHVEPAYTPTLRVGS